MAAIHWGIPICGLFFCSKLLGKSPFWPFCCFKLLGNFHLQDFFCIELPSFCAKLFEDFDCELLLCFRLLRGYDSESSYILNTPPPLIWRFRFIIYLKYGPLMWRFRFIIHLKHAPSFGDSGSSYILNVATSLDDCDSSYILNTPPRVVFPFIISVKHSPVIWRLAHMAIPVHHIS